MTKSYDAIIIGAGVIGASIAKEMAEAGYKTLSLDKLPEAGHGSTSGSCAIIRTYYSAFETCALAYEGWFYWKDWENYIGRENTEDMIQYFDTGCLVIKTDHNNHLKNVCDMMDQVSCPYEHIATEDIHKRFGGVNTERFDPAKRPDDDGFGQPTGGNVSGAVFFPRGGYVSDPKLAAQNAQSAAAALGAEFMFNAEVTEIRQSDNRVQGVTLSDGTQIDAPILINVAGPHSFVINKMAGVVDKMKMTTRALRHEVAHVPAPASLDYENNGVIYSDSDIHTYARPEVGNNILIGSEDPPCDPQEWIEDPDVFDDNITDQCKTLAMRLAQRLPDLGIPEQGRGLVALYDVSEDWMPIYDKSDLGGFYMAIGTSGNQFKNAPVVGKLMTHLIKTVEGGQDHDQHPVSFHLDNINKDISLDAFSRNREINQNSSFSVIG
ncbi:FAD-binding oxidoreductase [Amylibacter sp. SFDW26]|uniref:NAD(P)/FAD-dependent oxidoreductase n=1 Tax=Amylibacter sp. SFDW26 TaxID=2652722 RepID=UPI0012624205|nr:FAD-dependent oxidoreductase [Amylibacter sp. SFDW26]KAB7615777.1 FAD-binding oxidoreductase [Amylibacter sp. SFDW26]